MKKWTKKAEETQEATVQTAEETGVPQKSKGRRIANTIINIVLVIAIILAAVCTYTSYVSTSGNGVPSIFGLRVMSIQTESMYPTMKPGDLIFDTAVKDTGELKIGDIITYWTVIDGERVLNTHRITEIYDGGGYLIFQTKGDNNTIEDSLTVHESEIVGQYNGMKIAGLGKLFDYLQTSTGFLIVVVIPVAIFFLYHLIQFFRVLFEYQSVKNKLLYEKERGKNEDLVEDEKRKLEENRQAERKRMETELREKLRAELLAASAPAAEEAPAVAEEPKTKEKPAEEAPKESAEEMEARIRAEMEAEAKAKAEAEAKAKAEAEARAAMEAEIRAKIKAEMEAEAAAKAKEESEAEG
jgi:signal peptidase I